MTLSLSYPVATPSSRWYLVAAKDPEDVILDREEESGHARIALPAKRWTQEGKGTHLFDECGDHTHRPRPWTTSIYLSIHISHSTALSLTHTCPLVPVAGYQYAWIRAFQTR